MRHRSATATADEISGHWWLPSIDRRVAGRLTFPPDDAVTLALLGVLDAGEEKTYPVAFGLADDGTPITLVQLTWIGAQNTSSMHLEEPYRRETLMVGAVFVGAHLASEEDRQFDEGFLDLSDLLTWAGSSGLTDRLESMPRSVAVELTLPEPREAKLNFGTVSLSHAWGLTGDGLKARGIEKDVSFWVRTEVRHDLDWWLASVVGPLRHFMTFAADRPNELRDFTVRTYRFNSTGDDIAIRYARPPVLDSPSRWWEFLFDTRSAGVAFEEVLPRWFDLVGEIGPVVDVLLAQRYRPKVFAETRFLDAAIAAETYHRARMPNELLPEAEHRARLAEIFGAIPERHRPWLKERLAYSNEPTFRLRLEQLVAGSPARSLGVFGKPAEFAGQVVKIRNTLVHDPRRRAEAGITGRELHVLAERLTLLVSAHLLHDLGLDEAALLDCLRRTRRFRLLAEWPDARARI